MAKQTKLPDRKGVETILDAFRQAKTIEQVNARVRLYANVVQEMVESPSMHVRAIHIKNMAAYRRMCINRGWG